MHGNVCKLSQRLRVGVKNSQLDVKKNFAGRILRVLIKKKFVFVAGHWGELIDWELTYEQ